MVKKNLKRRFSEVERDGDSSDNDYPTYPTSKRVTTEEHGVEIQNGLELSLPITQT